MRRRLAGVNARRRETGGGSTLNWTPCIFALSPNNDSAGDYDIGTGEYSAGDQAGTWVDEGMSISGTGPIFGSYSFLLAGYGGMSFAVSSMDIIKGDVGSFCCWRNFSALPTGNEYLFVADGGDGQLYFNVGSGGELTFRAFDGVDQLVTYTSTDAGLTTGVDYFIELQYNNAGTVTMYVNNVQLTVSGSGDWDAVTGKTSLLFGDWNNEAGEGKLGGIKIFNASQRLWDYRSAVYGD